MTLWSFMREKMKRLNGFDYINIKWQNVLLQKKNSLKFLKEIFLALFGR